MRKHKKEIDEYKARVSTEELDKKLNFLSEAGIHPKWHRVILLYVPTRYPIFVDFYLKNKLDLNDLLTDFEYICRNMFVPGDIDIDYLQDARLNVLREYYEANNFFREKEPANKITHVFHDEVKLLTPYSSAAFFTENYDQENYE